MKSATQPGVTSAPLVLPTSAKHPFAKLVIRGDLGQIVQQWLILQNKCTIGSASSCPIRCELPGIAPYHALLVIGAKQTFIRALAPKLTRDGEPLNELLLTEADYGFEIAGHKFELLRNVKSVQRTPAAQPSATRMKFTLARPFELNRPRPAAEAEQPANLQANAQDLPAAHELNARWIADLIQSAVQPLEHQILSIIEPLNAVKMELAKSKKATRPPKRRRLPKISRQMLNAKTPIAPEYSSEHVPVVAAPPESPLAPSKIPLVKLPTPVQAPAVSSEQNTQQTNQQTGPQNSAIATAHPEPATTAEAINANAEVSKTVSEAIADQDRPLPAAIELLFAKQSASLDILSERLADMNSQLGSLERIVAENIASTKENIPAPTPSNQESIDRLQATTDRLGDLLQELQSRQTESEKSDETWRDEIRQQINDLQLEIRRPIPAPLPAASPLEQPASQPAAPSSTQVPGPVQSQTGTADWPIAPAPAFLAPAQAIAQIAVPAAEPNHAEKVALLSIQPSLESATTEPVSNSAAVQAEFIPQAITSHPIAEPIAQPVVQNVVQNVVRTIEQPIEQSTNTEHESDYNSRFGFSSEPSFSDSIDANANSGVQADLGNFAPWLQDEVIDSVPSAVAIQPLEQPSVQSGWEVNDFVQPTPKEAVSASAPPAEGVANSWEDSQDYRSQFGFGTENSEPAPHFPAAVEAVHQTPISKSFSPTTPNEQPVAHEHLLAVENTDGTAIQPSSEWLTAIGPAQASPTPEANTTPAATVAPEANQAFASQIEQPVAAEQPRQIEAASTSLPSWWTEEESSVGTASGVFAGRPVSEPYIPRASSPVAHAIESEPVESKLSESSSDVDDASEADLAAIYRRFGMQMSDSEPANSEPANSLEVASTNRLESPVTHQQLEAEADLPLAEEDSEQLASLFQMFGVGGQATEEQPSSQDPDEAVAPAKIQGNIAHTNYAPFANDYKGESLEDAAAESKLEANAADGGASHISAERAQAAMALTPYELPQPIEDSQDIETFEDPTVTDNSLESSGSGSSAGGDEEESIEDYMTRLLARMRGGEEAPANPANSGIRKASTRAEASGVMRPSEASNIMSSGQLKQLPETTRNSQTATAPFNPEEYVPRALAPEKTKNLAAMRELANTSARSAIQVSARRKYGTALAIKLIIASIGFGVGCTLIMINGLNLNIGLIATVASFLVALIWGFDAISTIKPILNAGSDKEKAAAAAAAAAEAATGGNTGTGENN